MRRKTESQSDVVTTSTASESRLGEHVKLKSATVIDVRSQRIPLDGWRPRGRCSACCAETAAAGPLRNRLEAIVRRPCLVALTSLLISVGLGALGIVVIGPANLQPDYFSATHPLEAEFLE